MGALTKQERDALEDVFLSIESNKKRYTHISTIVLKLLYSAKIGLQKGKNSNFFNFSYKKKKFLSK